DRRGVTRERKRDRVAADQYQPDRRKAGLNEDGSAAVRNLRRIIRATGQEMLLAGFEVDGHADRRAPLTRLPQARGMTGGIGQLAHENADASAAGKLDVEYRAAGAIVEQAGFAVFHHGKRLGS